MEQGRVLIAIALSLVVFLVWSFLFSEKPPVKEVTPGVPSQSQKPPSPTESQPVVSTEAVSPGRIKPGDLSAVSQRVPREIEIDTPLYRLNISEEGARVKSVVLKNFRETVEKNSPLKSMVSEKNPFGALWTEIGENGSSFPRPILFSVNIQANALTVSDEAKEMIFSWVSPQGIHFEKRFLFDPKSYVISMILSIKNNSTQTLADRLSVSLTKSMGEEGGQSYGFEGASALMDNGVERIEEKKIKNNSNYSGNIKWMAIQDRYFMSTVIPTGTENAQMNLFLREPRILEAQYTLPSVSIEPGMERRFEYRLFFGPKSTRILKESGYQLDKAIDFGMFDFIAKPCVWLMNLLYGFIPNYGVAIIILTILSKILLWPLGNKSYKSMSEMKKLQPLLTEMREKYKNDKKKMQQETMNLYKTYKINPLGGCLPMVAQIPVFFALYRMLYEAIELRHAPFFGWINDLSAPDRLFHFNFSIPFMQPPYGIPVLTIVMGATMLLQQKMSPPPGDPGQAKMMMLMPVIFTFIFINFSSGLVLYWLVNNILSIAQQYYVTKKSA
ncbi:MAG: membrane protein insertase YidC [Thermodesulfobacteriota bacterium]